MSEENLRPCRKCKAPNRVDNTYCRKCGAVLDVGTTEIRAQRKPVMPRFEGMRWRYVLIGIFVMLGFVFFLSFAAFIAGRALGFGSGGIGSLATNIIQIGFIAAALFFVAFGISGVVLAWLARDRITREVALSTVLVIGMLGVVGSLLTSDFLIVAGLLFLPSLASAVLGVRLTKVAGHE